MGYGLGKRLRAVDGMAYRRPAVLGDQLTVHTTPFEDGSSNHAQTIERDGVQLMTVRRTSDEEVTPNAAPAPIFGKVRLSMQHICRHDDLDALLADGISVVVAGVDGLRHATVPANIGDTVEVIADVSQVKTRIVFDQYVAVNGT